MADPLTDLITQLISFVTTLSTIPNQLLELFAPRYPPLSSLFIVILAVGISAVMALISRKLVDTEKLARYTREVKAYSALKMQMAKSADRRIKMKVERNAKRMQKIQGSLTTMQMKPLLVTMIPMMLFFITLSGFYNYNRDTQDFIIVGPSSDPARGRIVL